MRSDLERIKDIQEAIANIEKYSIHGKIEFFENELIATWIIHHLQIIGETVRSISDELKLNYPKTPWLKIADFRNLIVHEYFRVDLQIVWSIVENQLPQLKEQIETILQEMSNNE